MPKNKELKIKPAEQRVTLIKALPYKGNMIYLRKIGVDYFEYIVVFKNEIYTHYSLVKPPKGKKDFTKDQIREIGAMVMSGALATIDTLLGTKLDKETKKKVKVFEKSREAIEKVNGKVVN